MRLDLPTRDGAVLLLFWALAVTLNFAKPFHIDDTAHLLIAQHILENPLHPMSGLVNWLDTAEPIFVTNQPHFFFYLTAAMVKLFGASELALHVGMAVLTAVAILFSYLLARRFLPETALYLTGALVLSPGFLIIQNIMADLALLLMMTGAVLLLGRRDPTRARAVAGFGLFSLALLTKYSALFLFPALIWASAQKRSLLKWAFLPVFALLGWSVFNLWDYGAVHILNRPANEGGLFPSPKLFFALLSNLGVFALPVAGALMVAGQYRLIWAAVFVAGTAGFYAMTLIAFNLPAAPMILPNALLFGASIVAGAAALLRFVQLLASMRQHKNPINWYREHLGETTLILWLAGGAVFLSTFPPFMATRHALLLALPLGILALRADQLQRLPRQGAIALVIWAAFGAFVTLNDIQFARFYRDQAPLAMAQARDLAGPGAKIYTRGHWGWQWYAARAGMTEYDSATSNMRPGDLLVDPVGISAQTVEGIGAFSTLATLSQTQSVLTLLDTHRFYASGAVTRPVLMPLMVREIQILRKEN